MISMGSAGILPRVYTLPDCPKCDELKEWLQDESVEFDVQSFDTDAQLEFIMKNMFGNPPILELGDDAYPSEVLFPKEVLDVDKLKEVLGSA